MLEVALDWLQTSKMPTDERLSGRLGGVFRSLLGGSSSRVTPLKPKLMILSIAPAYIVIISNLAYARHFEIRCLHVSNFHCRWDKQVSVPGFINGSKGEMSEEKTVQKCPRLEV